MNRSLIAALILAGLSACQSTSEGANDPLALDATWQEGHFELPASATVDGIRCLGIMKVNKYSCHDKLDVGRRHPVVIFVHGCSGMRTESRSISKHTVTVGPNSMARPNRSENCDVNADKRGIMRLRFAEVRYAYSELLKLPWVDTSKIYLAGFSEGGVTAALYSGEERFAGRIILGWVCASGGNWWVGINGPPVPTLAVAGSDDKYHKDQYKWGRNCGEHFGGRPHSKSIVIKGAPHDILRYGETDEAIREFFETVNGT